MKRSIIIIQVFLAFYFTRGFGQTLLFSEDFESGEIPLNWKEEFSKGAISWRYENGGYTTSPAIPNSRRPMSAHGGQFNALFHYQSMNSEATKLVTTKISALEFAVKPELHFFHAQYDWIHPPTYHDYLRVYYKSSSASAWNLLQQYTVATTNWVERIILLPENDLSADYYLAFEGETKWGWGTCVDDIQILETGIRQKVLSDISVEQVSDISIGSGSLNNPVMRIDLKVTGNSGYCPVNSLVLNSLNTSDADIESAGVKLFLTRDAEFNSDNQVGTGVSFVSGQAAFTNLNFDLPTGYSFLWVTFDIKTTAGHRDLVDVKLAPGNININGQTYFTTEKSPAGSRTILRTLQSDDFEPELKWSLSGEFEYGSPNGLGGAQGNPDPVQAFSGTHIIGTDLSGIGDYPGDYEKYLETSAYSAVSDTIDFTYYNDLSLRYMRYLNIGINDEASIDISADGGKTWKEAWSNTSMILDDSWKLHEIDITALAARKKNVLVRYDLGTTNDYWQLSGWNIDNFSITGNYVTNDAGISRIVSPVNGCNHTSADSVTVVVKNFGAEDSYGIIPLQYSFDGNITRTYDTLRGVIPFGDSVRFTFKKKVDLSVAGIYNIMVATGMNHDEDISNDGINTSLIVQTSIDHDYTENFESLGGLWIVHAGASPDWELGTPGYGITPPSGSKLWMTQLLKNYPDNDSSFIESVCYRNTNNDRKILQLKYWVKSEALHDGAAVQYSMDNGTNWQLLDTLVPAWNWYTDSVYALHSKGWAGISGGWMTAMEILPKAVTLAPEAKFRVAFVSDSYNNDIGFALDDFGIYTAPPDIGVIQIDSFADRCQYLNPDRLTVTIRNYGINPVRTDVPVIVGFDLNHVHMATDTFNLATDLMPGQTIKHTFNKPVDVTDPGEYNLTAFTGIEADPYFYSGNNDSLSLDFEVLPVPLTMLEDTIPSREPDTIIIRPFYNEDYDYLWNDMSTLPAFNVDHPGWCRVKVTAARGNGCISFDSTYVQLLFNDTGIDSLIYPFNHCGLGKEEFLQVRIRNFGTDSLAAGQKIGVTYTLDEGPSVSDTITLLQSLYARRTLIHEFERGAVDLSAKGNYHFKIFSTLSGDTIRTNDTLYKNVEIFGHPFVDIGPDTTVKALSYILDAGSGYSDYLWDNSATGQTREITGSGTFWIRVTDENQCDNYDTASIFLKIRDVRPDGFASPLSACQFTTSETVSLRVMNAGTDTIHPGELISMSYLLNGGSRTSESFDLTVPLLPGGSFTHDFAGTLDLADTADYNFEATAAIDNDIRQSNDTTAIVVYRYPKPNIDFGLDDIISVEGIEFPLDAGYSPHYAYLWQDNYSQPVYNTTRSGNYSVKVTDMRTSCFDGDTVTVFLVYTDIGIISTSVPVEGCTGDLGHVVVEIGNLGTSNIGKEVPIYIACDVNGKQSILDTLVRTDNFITGSSLFLELSSSLTIPESDTNRISFYTLYEHDMKSWNDTLIISFFALPAPVIDFGDMNGILDIDLPYILDAGPGNKGYLWQDGSVNQSYTVTQKGIYSVTVTAQNDCQASRSVRINLSTNLGSILKEGIVNLYPDPNHGIFYISIEQEEWKELSLQIINNQGQVVYTDHLNLVPGQPQSIDAQHLARGMYHVIIQNNGLVYREKMIIQ